ncbi:MAG: NAD(P)H-binding protein [Rhodospirillales bacterium]|nr:NAD(P)H-binding protein [Rhodospirillales bacterium]
MKIAVLGATSDTGRQIVARLCERGHDVTALGRNAAKLATLDPRAQTRAVRIEDTPALTAALAGAATVASLAPAARIPAVIAALPESCRRVVLVGSLRRFTSLADPVADIVRAGEAAFLASERAGIVLHPSLIYGAANDRNVGRILGVLARFPRWLPILFPLPGGGRHTIQPVFIDDVAAAFVAAIENPTADGPPIAIVGPEPIAYRDMVRACAAALGRRIVIVPVPVAVLVFTASTLIRLGLRLPFDVGAFARMKESKNFDAGDMQERLNIYPRSFAQGLALKIAREGWR